MGDNNISLQQEMAAILQQMGQIPCLIRGKLTSQTYAGKGGSQGPYYTLQRWDDGENKSQRIPPEQLPMIQDGVAGFELFQRLADRYVGLLETQTWDAQAADVKEKFRKFSHQPFPTPASMSKKRANRLRRA